MKKHDPPKPEVRYNRKGKAIIAAPHKPTTWPVMPLKSNVPITTAQHWASLRLNSMMATAQEYADNQAYEQLFHIAVSAFEQGWLMRNMKEK